MRPTFCRKRATREANRLTSTLITYFEMFNPAYYSRFPLVSVNCWRVGFFSQFASQCRSAALPHWIETSANHRCCLSVEISLVFCKKKRYLHRWPGVIICLPCLYCEVGKIFNWQPSRNLLTCAGLVQPPVNSAKLEDLTESVRSPLKIARLLSWKPDVLISEPPL